MHTAEHRAISNTCQLHASARQAYNVRLHERGQGGPPAAGCLGALAGWRLPCKSTRRLSACPPCPCTGAGSSMQRMGTWCGSAVSWGRRHLVTHQTEGCFASGTLQCLQPHCELPSRTASLQRPAKACPPGGCGVVRLIKHARCAPGDPRVSACDPKNTEIASPRRATRTAQTAFSKRL